MTIKGTDKGIDEQAGQSWDAIFETEVLPEWVDYNLWRGPVEDAEIRYCPSGSTSTII